MEAKYRESYQDLGQNILIGMMIPQVFGDVDIRFQS